jgi:hypothetical protein
MNLPTKNFFLDPDFNEKIAGARTNPDSTKKKSTNELKPLVNLT